jgi:hypothetical protein
MALHSQNVTTWLSFTYMLEVVYRTCERFTKSRWPKEYVDLTPGIEDDRKVDDCKDTVI